MVASEDDLAESSTELCLSGKDEPPQPPLLEEQESGCSSTTASTGSSSSGSDDDNEEEDMTTTASSSRMRPLAYFHRDEIELGEQVGEGYFSKVYEIKGFCLRQRCDGYSDCDSSNDKQYSSQEERLRQEYCHQAKDGPRRFVLKHLNPRLLQQRQPQQRRQGSSSNSQSRGRYHFENAVMDLLAEANFLQQFHHPHILSLKGLAQGGTDAYRGGRYDSYFLITERLSETLAQRIQRWKKKQPQSTRKLLLETKCSYALQIGQALQYLHEQRLIYRDLKPDNIGFKEKDDCLQIFDFGLCRSLPPATRTSTSADDDATLDDVFDMSGGVGTRRYCAVEVCRHQPYNTKADVYSWAMVFWELLTLEKPFATFTKQDHTTFVCDMGGTPNLSSRTDISPRIQTLLRHAWARHVSKRWTMARVCDELQDILRNMGEDCTRLDAGQPVKAQQDQTSSSHSCSQPRRRSKGMDRKDVMVSREEEQRCTSMGLSLAARA